MKTTKVSGSEEDYEIEDILYFRVTDGDKEGKKISDSPLNVSTRLYNVSGNVRFIDQNKIYGIKMS